MEREGRKKGKKKCCYELDKVVSLFMRGLTDTRLFERNMQGTDRYLLWRAWLGVFFVWPIATQIFKADNVFELIKDGFLITG